MVNVQSDVLLLLEIVISLLFRLENVTLEDIHIGANLFLYHL